MQIQWFPGHMTKTKRMIEQRIKLVDVVIELTDARLPLSSRNPLLDSLVGHKPRMVILNKEDLADPQQSALWMKYFDAQNNCRALVFNSTMGKKKLIGELKNILLDLTASKRERLAAKGIRMQSIRCMVVGIPNVGKSTFINILAGKKSAKTGDKPGVTRGEQWIKLEDGIELLDTPGILWHKFEDEEVGFRLAMAGSISDEVFDWEEGAYKLCAYLKTYYPILIQKRYKLVAEEMELEPWPLLEEMGRKRGFLIKGNKVDMQKMSKALIIDFRQGKIGRITLERAGEKLKEQQIK